PARQEVRRHGRDQGPARPPPLRDPGDFLPLLRDRPDPAPGNFRAESIFLLTGPGVRLGLLLERSVSPPARLRVTVMVDPRLNSLHLDPVRRQDYRRAREALLQSRGHQTMYLEGQHGDDGEPSSTFIRNLGAAAAPVHLDYWLVDKEFIYPLRVGLNTV